jgi:hypothetical protein
MKDDPIVEEVRKVREAFAAAHNYDIAAMVADLRRRQQDSHLKVVLLPPKPPSHRPAPTKKVG